MLSAGFLGLAAMAGALAGLPAGIRLSDHISLGVIASAPGRRGQRWWQMPPLVAGAHEVEEAIQQLSHIRGPRPPTGLGGRDERLQQAKLVVRQGLAGAKIPDQRAISRRPQGGLQTGNHLQRRPTGQDQPVRV